MSPEATAKVRGGLFKIGVRNGEAFGWHDHAPVPHQTMSPGLVEVMPGIVAMGPPVFGIHYDPCCYETAEHARQFRGEGA
jgi:hypothetical protein